jgi:basic membrane lipoprotein Med (substrate-binding protein (PBP1-ABC) superfamily)
MRPAWKVGLLAVVTVVVVSVIASGALSKTPTNDAQRAAAAKKVKVALILPCAINDRTWCQQAYEAAKKLQARGLIDLTFTSNSPQDTAGVSQLMAQYAARGAQIVIGHSAWQDAAFRIASRFPKTVFAYAGGGKVRGNVTTYEEPIYLPAYLAGMLAAGVTKTRVIGASAGQDIPLCHAEVEAFRLGAQRIKRNIRELKTYLGDWNDVTKAKEATLAQADRKADVFIACGDGPSRGMIQAIKQRNLSGFGYVGNMNGLAPRNMIGSLVYNLEPIFKKLVQDVGRGKYKAKPYDLGIKSFALKLNKRYRVRKIPASVMAKMKAAQRQISRRKLRVPYITH